MEIIFWRSDAVVEDHHFLIFCPFCFAGIFGVFIYVKVPNFSVPLLLHWKLPAIDELLCWLLLPFFCMIYF
jgi:hypothetical protein